MCFPAQAKFGHGPTANEDGALGPKVLPAKRSKNEFKNQKSFRPKDIAS